MRNIKTIRQELQRLRESEFRHMYTQVIGVYLWVLGLADTPCQGYDIEEVQLISWRRERSRVA